MIFVSNGLLLGLARVYSSAVCLQLHKTAICKTGKCDIAKTSYGNATIQEVVEANDNLKISKPCKKRKLTWPLDLYL